MRLYFASGFPGPQVSARPSLPGVQGHVLRPAGRAVLRDFGPRRHAHGLQVHAQLHLQGRGDAAPESPGRLAAVVRRQEVHARRIGGEVSKGSLVKSIFSY